MAGTASELGPWVRRLENHSTLTPAERQAIVDLPARVTRLRPHARLYRHGDAAQHCSVLLDGYGCRYTLLYDGGRQILSLLLPGDLVDVDRLAADRIDHAAEMLTPGDVATIPVAAIEAMLALHPGIARALWRATAADAAVQREWTVNVGRRRAHERVAHFLCELGIRHEVLGIGSRTGFPWVMTQSQLGDCTGLTSVHVNRVLRTLRESGLIDGDKRHLAITDWTGLARLSGFDETYLCLHDPRDAGATIRA